MNERKERRKYTFTVEGETEQWYLYWLRDQINSKEESKYEVSIVPKVAQNPLKFAKELNVLQTPEVTHLCDYESNQQVHQIKFRRILSNLREANEIVGKSLKYSLGYSNFTFELWIVLHKRDYFRSLENREQYLAPINSIFDEHFQNLDEYKRENNFKRCLSKLKLEDVKDAVKRSKGLMNQKTINGIRQQEYKTFNYYSDNPALTIWESIEKILNDCGLMN